LISKFYLDGGVREEVVRRDRLKGATPPSVNIRLN
jgi:hypothetical protein